jgi:hypothetical protein
VWIFEGKGGRGERGKSKGARGRKRLASGRKLEGCGGRRVERLGRMLLLMLSNWQIYHKKAGNRMRRRGTSPSPMEPSSTIARPQSSIAQADQVQADSMRRCLAAEQDRLGRGAPDQRGGAGDQVCSPSIVPRSEICIMHSRACRIPDDRLDL